MDTTHKALAAVVGFVLAGMSIAEAGVRPSAISHLDTVDAFTTHTYRLVFGGYESATVTVIGAGATDLDLQILDENGNEVARDFDDTDCCVVTWTPRWTGTFKIRIINRGSVYNDYLLLTN